MFDIEFPDKVPIGAKTTSVPLGLFKMIAILANVKPVQPIPTRLKLFKQILVIELEVKAVVFKSGTLISMFASTTPGCGGQLCPKVTLEPSQQPQPENERHGKAGSCGFPVITPISELVYVGVLAGLINLYASACKSMHWFAQIELSKPAFTMMTGGITLMVMVDVHVFVPSVMLAV